MPVIHTYSSTPIPPAARDSLKATWGRAIESVPGKSEAWLMCIFDENVPMYHAGTDDAPAAYVTVDVFARGAVDSAAWQAMTPVICEALQEQLGVDPARVYVKYGECANFGWNGANF
jgi:hypothetical protein